MPTQVRLRLVVGIIVLSATYALFIAWNPGLASVVALGYVAVLITILTVLQFWKASS